MTGRVDLGWKNKPYETFTCLEKVRTSTARFKASSYHFRMQVVELVRDDKDQIFEKGEHTFAFSMIVTSSAGEQTVLIEPR